MNKKKIGAALSVVAAVTAGATAYASTINNLEADKNTNSMIQPDYQDRSYDYYSLVKSDYTNDLKNTAIANEEREVQNTKQTEEDVAKIEQKAKDILATNIYVKKEEDSNQKDNSEAKDEQVEVSEESYENEKNEEEKSNTNDLEVVAYDDKKLDEVEEESTEEENIEESTAEETNSNEEEELDHSNQELEEDESEASNKESGEDESEDNEVIAYDNKNLDSEKEESEDNIEEDSEIADANAINYLDSNNENIESNENKDNEIEAETTPTVTSKFVNVEALNLRDTKSMDDNLNVIRALVAGEKVTGEVEGEWLHTEEGYLKLSYLSDEYPQTLVDSINEKQKAKEEENKKIKAEEEKKAKEEAKKAREEEKTKQEAQAAAKKAEESQKQAKEEQTNTQEKGQAFTGWVYNTAALNVREKAQDGKILGALTKGTKISGEILNGWVKFDYNGKTAYASSAYISTTEVAEERTDNQEQNSNQQDNNQNQQQNQQEVEEVVEEQEIVAEEHQAAPASNASGQQAANIASGFVGSPYVWGASNPSVGFDCSGLVKYAYQQLGVNLPHSSGAQFGSGYVVNINSLQPGDLVFFSNRGSLDHVGIVVSSDGTFIHASTPNSGVKYDNVYSSYYQKVFSGARRIF